MKILLKIINIFFTILGIIFFILLLVGVYLWLVDPFKLKPLLFSSQAPAGSTVKKTPSSNPLLTQEQITGLQKLGIDTSKIPTSITPTMDACLIAKLGVARTNAIKQGSLITAIDLYQAQSCLK